MPQVHVHITPVTLKATCEPFFRSLIQKSKKSTSEMSQHNALDES